MKLYYDGNWKEILVDDYIPCLKNQPLLCTNFNEDIGWFILQKAIAKIYGSYFSEGNDKKIVEEFLKMLTGLPTKTINCLNINNCIASLQKYRDNKVKLIHFRDEYYKKYSILKNLPLILKDYIKINDQNGIFVVKNLEGILKIPDALDLTSLIPEYFELLKSQINFEDSHLHFFEKNTLKEIFSDINILLATEDLIMNSAKFAIFCEINDDFFQYDVNKLFLKIVNLFISFFLKKRNILSILK